MNIGANAKQVILAIAEKIRHAYQPEEIILFGSYAYGQPDGSSDVDLLIVKQDSRPRLERQTEVSRLVEKGKGNLSVCPFVYTPDELDRRLSLGDPFLQQIIQKGVVLYASSGYSSKTRLPNPYKKPGKEIIIEWFKKAERDLSTARLAFEHEDLLEPATAHLHDGAEKYLKAYLLFHGWRLERTHDLVELLGEAVKHDQDFSRFLLAAERLTKLYLPARYPSEIPFDLEREEFQAHLHTMEEMVERITSIIA